MFQRLQKYKQVVWEKSLKLYQDGFSNWQRLQKQDEMVRYLAYVLIMYVIISVLFIIGLSVWEIGQVISYLFS